MPRLKVVPIAAVVLLILAFPHFAPSQYVYYAIWALIGILWALGLNFFFGYCGQINFGVTAYGAIPAYAVALLKMKVGLPFPVALLLALVITAVVTYIVGLLFVRLRHLVLGLATLAFALAVYVSVSSGFVSITRGEDGLFIDPLKLFGTPLSGRANDMFFFYVFLVVAALGYFVAHAVLHSRVGRAMRAIREDEEAAISMGVNVHRYIILALMLLALYSAVAATLFVQYIGMVAPAYFSLHYIVLPLVAVVVGGIGSPVGAVIGGAFIFVLPHVLVAVQEWHNLAYGVILILMLRFAPWGIVGAGQRLLSLVQTARARRSVVDGSP